MYLYSLCLCSLHLHWCVFNSNNNKLTLERLGSLIPVCERQVCLADVSVRVL